MRGVELIRNVRSKDRRGVEWIRNVRGKERRGEIMSGQHNNIILD